MEEVTQDLTFFINRALDGMSGIIAELGDQLANKAPQLPGANSPFAILSHCLGVMEYWGGHVIAGRTISRDRPAEFVARGPIGELLPKVSLAKEKLWADLKGVDLEQTAKNPPTRPFESPQERLTNEVVVLHILEELIQHHGQMEITRDLLKKTLGTLPAE